MQPKNPSDEGTPPPGPLGGAGRMAGRSNDPPPVERVTIPTAIVGGVLIVCGCGITLAATAWLILWIVAHLPAA